MLIAIASDLHDNLSNWDIFNQQMKKQEIKSLLFCGDLCNEETLTQVAKSYEGNIYLISGNGELYSIKLTKNIDNLHHLGRYGTITIDKLKIALIHEPEFQAELEKEQPQPDFIFYGHTHKPWFKKENNTIVANPGTLGGVFYPATYATLDTVSKELKLMPLFS